MALCAPARVFATVDEEGKLGPSIRVEHELEQFRKYLRSLAPESPVAVEASGGWYWLMSELEAAGLEGVVGNDQTIRTGVGHQIPIRGRNRQTTLVVDRDGCLTLKHL